MNDYLEIKLHKNKPAQQFRCTLLKREQGHAVLRYVSDEPSRIADMHIEPGSATIAHYWTHRPYVAWRMFDRTGRLIGTLFHVCGAVHIFEDHLSYEDLLLDIWIAPDGSVRILDEDEVRDCAAQGLLSDSERHRIDSTRRHITELQPEIIAGLAAFENADHHNVRPPSSPDQTAHGNSAAADI